MADVEAPIVQVDLPRSYGDSGQLLSFTATAKDNVRVKTLTAEFADKRVPLFERVLATSHYPILGPIFCEYAPPTRLAI